MNDDLISKKELLAKYGISYGALYRWKRTGLIPDEWFIKRSASTGQETYFDRVAITERIEAILAMKDSLSLDEIAEKFRAEDGGRYRTQSTLRFTWKFGEKDIPLNDLCGIFIVNSTGETVEITEKIKKLATEAFSNE